MATILRMHTNRWCSLALLLCLGSGAFAFPRPLPGTEDIPKMIAGSTLVCKGEVVEAPNPMFLPSPAGMPRITATASVRLGRCFKGNANGSSIPVLFDGYVPGVEPSFFLRKRDYRLFFLKPQNGKYTVVDVWFGALPVSRKLGPASQNSDAMYLLELDLKAGLTDSNRERVLDSIRMLGNMKYLNSTSELTQLLGHGDLLVKAYVWQALLRLKDYSVLPRVSEFFNSQPEPPRELLLPRDRLFEMQGELALEIGAIRDPTTLPFLERFALARKSSILRMQALQALRAIGSPDSAPTFLKELSDSNSDNAFSAMQGLLSLAGSFTAWAPTWEQFRKTPEFYAAKCRQWWQTEGRWRAANRSLAHF